MNDVDIDGDTSTAERSGTAPALKASDRGVYVHVFQNTGIRDDGEPVTYYSTSIHTRYQDRHGEWRSGDRYSEHQLTTLEDLAREARQFIRRRRSEDRAAGSP